MSSPKPLPPAPGLKLSQDIADLVAADHQPRQATADDDSVHMLFWDGVKVRSVLFVDWPAEQAKLTAQAAAQVKRAALRQQIRAAAQAHKGKRASQLTLPELRDVVMVLLEQAGLIDEDGNVV